MASLSIAQKMLSKQRTLKGKQSARSVETIQLNQLRFETALFPAPAIHEPICAAASWSSSWFRYAQCGFGKITFRVGFDFNSSVIHELRVLARTLQLLTCGVWEAFFSNPNESNSTSSASRTTNLLDRKGLHHEREHGQHARWESRVGDSLAARRSDPDSVDPLHGSWLYMSRQTHRTECDEFNSLSLNDRFDQDTSHAIRVDRKGDRCHW